MAFAPKFYKITKFSARDLRPQTVKITARAPFSSILPRPGQQQAITAHDGRLQRNSSNTNAIQIGYIYYPTSHPSPFSLDSLSKVKKIRGNFTGLMEFTVSNTSQSILVLALQLQRIVTLALPYPHSFLPHHR